jgi:hypothetical protein
MVDGNSNIDRELPDVKGASGWTVEAAVLA